MSMCQWAVLSFTNVQYVNEHTWFDAVAFLFTGRLGLAEAQRFL